MGIDESPPPGEKNAFGTKNVSMFLSLACLAWLAFKGMLQLPLLLSAHESYGSWLGMGLPHEGRRDEWLVPRLSSWDERVLPPEGREENLEVELRELLILSSGDRERLRDDLSRPRGERELLGDFLSLLSGERERFRDLLRVGVRLLARSFSAGSESAICLSS